MLSQEQVERYSRQVVLRDVGGRGQVRLLESTVHVDLGDSAASELTAIAYLAAAGVGTISLAGTDRPVAADEVAHGTLLHRDDIGKPLLDCIKRRIAALNGGTQVTSGRKGRRIGPLPRATSAQEALWQGGEAALDTILELAQAE